MSLVVAPVVEPVTTAWQITPKNPADTMIALASIAQRRIYGLGDDSGRHADVAYHLTHPIYHLSRCTSTRGLRLTASMPGCSSETMTTSCDLYCGCPVGVGWYFDCARGNAGRAGPRLSITIPQPTSPMAMTYSVRQRNVTTAVTALQRQWEANGLEWSSITYGKRFGRLVVSTFTVSLTTQYGGDRLHLGVKPDTFRVRESD